jgi:predicted membrane protein (TIGR00267 family)
VGINNMNQDTVARARRSLEEGEYWHKKTNVREIVFGFNDGSVSTLALLAGVTGGALSHGNIIIAGLSGVIAGAISMGIGAYISSKSEIEHHQSEIKKEKQEIDEVPEIEKEEIRQIYQKKAAFTDRDIGMIVKRITSDKKIWLDTMMKEELGLFEERFQRPVKVGLIMLVAFLAGGIIPVIPFMLINQSMTSLTASIALTFISLFTIGVWKTTLTGRNWLVSGVEMVGIGILATVVPYIIGDVLLTRILTNVIS